jgi:putative radical SAM enzyme (TIGR03279 family)
VKREARARGFPLYFSPSPIGEELVIRVASVSPGSVAEELGIQPGTELLEIDGRVLEDFLDWEFLSAEERFVLLARHPDGELVEYDIARPEGIALGIELEPPRIRRCGNRCDFCFVDGLPEGLRDTLYVRDDDYRLSFRYGNFATLTNLKPKDVERILAYRLSPLYVSVHATDPVVRRRILRNPLAPDIVEQLRMFAAGGIKFHTQIVLQPGVNDGPVLKRSLEDLYCLGEPILSTAVVPVGLTSFSKHPLVREPTREECRAAVEIVHGFGERALRERGNRWVYGSDELYLRAELPLPPADWYDDFQQVENGVGSVRYLQQQIAQSGPLPELSGFRIAVLTGAAMGRLMPEVLRTLAQQCGAHFELIVLANELFGPSVTCAGLLPGKSFIGALERRSDLDLALLPGEALDEHGRFLDDVTWDDLAAAVPVECRASYYFTDALREVQPV